MNPVTRLYASAFLTMTGAGFVLPVIPRWLEAAGASHVEVGVVATVAMGLGLVAARPLAGRLLEGRARTPAMIAGLVLSAVCCALYPAGLAVGGIAGAAVVRALHGVGFALVEVGAMALITDITPPAKRGQAMGYLGALVALSLVIGPAIGGTIAAAGGAEMAFYAAALGAALGIPPLMGLRAPRAPAVRSGRLVEALAVPGMTVLVAAHFATILAHGALIAFLPLRLPPDAPFPAEAFFATFAAIIIVTRIGVGRRFDVWPRVGFIVVGAAGMGLCVLGVALAGTTGGFVAAAVAYGIGMGVYMPAASARVGDVVPEHLRARGFAWFTLAFDLGFLSAGALLGPVSDGFGLAAAFAVAALGPLLGLVLHVAAQRRAVGPAPGG